MTDVTTMHWAGILTERKEGNLHGSSYTPITQRQQSHELRRLSDNLPLYANGQPDNNDPSEQTRHYRKRHEG